MPIHYNHNNIITLGKQIKNTAKSQWTADKDIIKRKQKEPKTEGQKPHINISKKKPHLKKNHFNVSNRFSQTSSVHLKNNINIK